MAVDKDFSVKNGLQVGTTISGGNTSVTGFINVSSTANIGGALSACSTLTVAANVNVDGGTLFVDATNNRVGIGTVTPDSSLKVVGNANVSGDLNVSGNLTISGTTQSVGTQVSVGDINPVSNDYSLGNTTSRWSVNGLTANFSNAVTINGNLTVSGTKTTINSIAEISDNKITISANATTAANAFFIVNRGSTGGNVSIRWNESAGVWQFTTDGTTFSTIGSSNATGTVTSVTVSGNTQSGLTGTGTVTGSGTITIGAQAANTTANGAVQLLDSVTNTSIATYAPTANAVKLAYDTAILANTRASSAQTAATAAYSNAVSFAANATNLTSGTVDNTRLNSGNTSAAGILQLVEGVTNTSVLYAATANSVKTAYDNSSTAYSNAITYADTKAATAYSNAITYADSKAATAYSNAISYSGNAAIAYSNAVAVAATDASTKAATAYSNATSYADSKAATAYSNAITYADSKAATAYSNATTFAANATNITSGIIANARLNSGNTSAAGILQLVEGVTNTSVLYAATANSAKTAYDTAILANTRASSAQTAATAAYSNAVSVAATDASNKDATTYANATTFAANATNITSGTLANARLPSAISVTSVTANHTGNGSGLTSVSYISTSTYATDVAVFSGGDSGAWVRASGSPIFYPTIPSGVSTLTIGVQLDLFIKQVADDVVDSAEVVAGAGNPQLRYRVVKGPANTVLFTSEFSVLSTPGSGGGYVVNAVDTTPTSGNSVGYEIQYFWRSGASDPNVNVGTISVSATNTPIVTGSGTYFTGTLNPRLQIARSSAPTTWKSISYITGNQSLNLEANWGNAFSATTYVVQDPFANVVMDQTNLVLTFIGYK